MKRKKQKKTNELEVGFKKLTNFTSESLNKVYKNYKNKQKIKDKNELKLREEQIKKGQKKIGLKEKEQSKNQNEIKLKEQELGIKDQELSFKEKEQSKKHDKIKIAKQELELKEQELE